jgi:hypothetical protein
MGTSISAIKAKFFTQQWFKARLVRLHQGKVNLVGGHPYLVRKALYHLRRQSNG